MIRCLSFERDIVEGRLAKAGLVLGKAMASVVGFSRMDIVIVPLRTYTKKTSPGNVLFRS